MHWTDRIGRRLNPHDLHIFMAVVEQGNMARAADSLAISRPVVSRTIADLEHALGVRLLDRSPQGVEPTQYGRALLKRGIAAFDELAQGVKDIAFLADPTVGELRIGTSPGLAEGIVLATERYDDPEPVNIGAGFEIRIRELAAGQAFTAADGAVRM